VTTEPLSLTFEGELHQRPTITKLIPDRSVFVENLITKFCHRNIEIIL